LAGGIADVVDTRQIQAGLWNNSKSIFQGGSIQPRQKITEEALVSQRYQGISYLCQEADLAKVTV
jgi:hypothetical protein